MTADHEALMADKQAYLDRQRREAWLTRLYGAPVSTKRGVTKSPRHKRRRRGRRSR